MSKNYVTNSTAFTKVSSSCPSGLNTAHFILASTMRSHSNEFDTSYITSYADRDYVIDDHIQIRYHTVKIVYGANTASCTVNGVARANGETFTVPYNTKLTATFTANTGYHYSGSEATGWVNTHLKTVTVVSSTTTITGDAASINTYTVTIRYGNNTSTCTAGGATRANGATFVVNYGTSVTATFTATTGYHYSGSEAGGWVGTSSQTAIITSTYTFTGPNATINTYTVTISFSSPTSSASYGGANRANGYSFTVNYNTSVSVVFTAATGYHYSGSEGSYVNTTTVTRTITNTTTISPPSIAINTYTVTIVYGNNTASCTASGAARANNARYTVNHGTSVTATFTATTGYHYSGANASWNSTPTWNGTASLTVTVTGTTTITGPNASINTYWVRIVYGNNTASCTTSGTSRANGATFTVNYGSTVSAVFTASTGYSYSGSSTNTLTASSISSNVTLTGANATAISYTITIAYGNNTASCTTNGTSRANGATFTATYGTLITAIFTANTGYHYGSDLSTTTNTKTVTVTGTTTITGDNATINSYTVTVRYGSHTSSATRSGSTVSDGGTFSVNHGTSVSVTFYAASGYSTAAGATSSTKTSTITSATTITGPDFNTVVSTGYSINILINTGISSISVSKNGTSIGTYSSSTNGITTAETGDRITWTTTLKSGYTGDVGYGWGLLNGTYSVNGAGGTISPTATQTSSINGKIIFNFSPRSSTLGITGIRLNFIKFGETALIIDYSIGNVTSYTVTIPRGSYDMVAFEMLPEGVSCTCSPDSVTNTSTTTTVNVSAGSGGSTGGGSTTETCIVTIDITTGVESIWLEYGSNTFEVTNKQDYVVNKGTVITLTSNPESGYEFGSWSKDSSNTSYSAADPLTYTVNSDVYFKANMIQVVYHTVKIMPLYLGTALIPPAYPTVTISGSENDGSRTLNRGVSVLVRDGKSLTLTCELGILFNCWGKTATTCYSNNMSITETIREDSEYYLQYNHKST